MDDFDRLAIADNELERFRREWQEDLKRKVPANVPRDSVASSASPRVSPKVSPQVSPKATFQSLANKPTNIVNPSEHALQLYTEAVEHEQAGKLNEALILYRKAFKYDDNVDRLYARNAPSLPPPVKQNDAYTFQRVIQTQPDYRAPRRTQSPLTAILAAAPTLAFIPRDEDKPMPIASLPLELFEPILARLDVGSLERFATTCWQARSLTAKSLYWQKLVNRIYSPVDGQNLAGLAERHAGEWRTTFIEEPRVRLDGCYISVCHYIRPGAGDEWVAITHMITYHRFLRFYADGTVMSFLTTDHPSEIVPLLRSSLRAKGLHVGQWRLEGQQILISNLREPGMERHKYSFEMDLDLRTTGRGKWNKLDMTAYSSINLANEEHLALSLKHQKPFYFSKVKSYHPQL